LRLLHAGSDDRGPRRRLRASFADEAHVGRRIQPCRCDPGDRGSGGAWARFYDSLAVCSEIQGELLQCSAKLDGQARRAGLSLCAASAKIGPDS
jgi:hypothetical protein